MKHIAEELARIWGALFVQAIGGALEDWHSGKATQVRHEGRTRNSFIWDCAIARIRAGVADSSDFRVYEASQTAYFIYQDVLCIQLKALNKRGRTSSHHSGRVSRFMGQLPLGFEDDLELTHVYLTYQLDPYETSVQSISLRCPQGRSFTWIVYIDGPELKAGEFEFGPLPLGGTPQGGDRLRLRIMKDTEAEDATSV